MTYVERCMKYLALLSFVCLLTAVQAFAASTTAPSDTCLMAVARNISSGGGNMYLYCAFSRQDVTFQKGDVLEYDVYVLKRSPQARGGIDIDTDRGNLRDSQSLDDQGIRAHGDAALKPAVGKWYHRRISL